MQQQVKEIKYFFYSQAFADGFRTSFAILCPSLVGLYFNFFQTGLTISLGSMCVSLTDAPGPVVHKRNGMLFATGFAFLMAVITGFARLSVYSLGLEIVMAGFLFSMLNVYGNRAASVGNSGILMMILTMDVALAPSDILPHELLILAGGVFYTLLSLLLHAIRPYRISQRVLGDCLHEIATYLSIKADFYDPSTDLDTDYRRLVAQQITVHEKQEAVRELLFKTRQIVEETTAEGRRLVFTFVETVDLFEDITASYHDYSALRKEFAGSVILKLISETLKKVSDELNAIGFAIQSNTGFKRDFEYSETFDQLKEEIDRLAPREQANTLVLRKILVGIRTLFTDIESILQYFQTDVRPGRAKLDHSQFVAHQSLDPRILWNNFSFDSFAFRHSLRVSIACLAGFLVANLISYGHHSYWILLTIAFILKPAYSLTKERNVQRIVGTFIGGILGVIILLATPNKTIHFIFLVLFMIGTYSFIRIKYLVSVICITPYILILFSFLGVQFKVLAEERLLDTVIGCIIALSASYFLFPSWEAGQLRKDMQGIVRANSIYLQKIIEVLSGFELNMLEYKLARKDVYLRSANISATFQRMLSEPKSKQGAERDIHQFVVLNHILFSNIANLSSSVLGRERRIYPAELVLTGKKALNKLNECRKQLDDSASIGVPFLKKELQVGPRMTADDMFMQQQLQFIYKLTSDLEKNIKAVVAEIVTTGNLNRS